MKNSADDKLTIDNYLAYFSKEIGFGITCKVCSKGHMVFSGKSKGCFYKISSAEYLLSGSKVTSVGV